jgi:hypothetical protein
MCSINPIRTLLPNKNVCKNGRVATNTAAQQRRPAVNLAARSQTLAERRRQDEHASPWQSFRDNNVPKARSFAFGMSFGMEAPRRPDNGAWLFLLQPDE